MVRKHHCLLETLGVLLEKLVDRGTPLIFFAAMLIATLLLVPDVQHAIWPIRRD